MRLIKFFPVLVVLIAKIHPSKSAIEINEPEGFGELEESAIQIVLTCYGNQSKTILVAGDYPGNFTRRLMSEQSFSLILLDDRRLAQNNNHDPLKIDSNRKHKVDVVVIISSYVARTVDLLSTYVHSVYGTPTALVLVISWHSTNKHAGCDVIRDAGDTLLAHCWHFLLNAKLMCDSRNVGILIVGFNPFVNRAPVPWKRGPRSASFSLFTRNYQEPEGTCTNIDFDKTTDLYGFPIRTSHAHYQTTDPSAKPDSRLIRDRRLRIQAHKRSYFISDFIAYVNATQQYQWHRVVVGELYAYQTHTMDDTPFFVRGEKVYPSFTYPHLYDCNFLVTQFRGNMSQLAKLYAVIDGYSWTAMYVVYLITFIFFKFFLRQRLMTGILNLCRLTCNFGVEELPSNVAPRIYIGCLLFFVVTMQGIFAGNLASLLTHEIPVRQVNSLKDLADLGYNVYGERFDSIFFEDPVFKGRFRALRLNENCTPIVLRDPNAACLIEGAQRISDAVNAHLHISTDCVAYQYLHFRFPWKWFLEEKLNTFLLITMATGITMPLDVMVDEKRFLELESQEVILNPEVMTLENLSFAFAILGIGLAFASITFIVEIIIHWYNCRITTTRVIFL